MVSFKAWLGIGESYQGGIIAYVLEPLDIGYEANIPHGLIAATSDQIDWTTGIYWDYPGASCVYGTNRSLGSGALNTKNIVTSLGNATYAAKVCDDLILNGYSDWFLPSINELQTLYDNRDAIGGFSNSGYWSSSEYSAWGYNGAYYLDFSVGMDDFTEKHSYPLLVRAVRGLINYLLIS